MKSWDYRWLMAGEGRRWGGASRLRFLALLALVILGTGLLGPAPSGAAAPAPEFVPGQLIVQYREGTTEGEQRAALGRANASPQAALRMQANGAPSLELVSLPATADVRVAAARIQADPAVAFAEPNFIYSDRPIQAALPSDSYFTGDWHWGMYGETAATNCQARDADGLRCRNTYGSQASEAWSADITGSRQVYVAVIDSGIDRSHPDLTGNMGTNPGETGRDRRGRDKATNRVDDDGNGYVDDVYGWNFAANNNRTFVAADDENHGTHVAGTIGARANNGTGVVGVNHDVQILAGKFFGSGSQNASLDAAVRAIDYFIGLKKRHGINLVAINASWGCFCYSQTLYDAIARANAANIVVVAAAGNDANNNDSNPYYPASYKNLPNLISVASINEHGQLSSFSNYGATTVHLGAPGEGIGSTLEGGGYGFWSGTSMAAPHVAGAAALYAAAALKEGKTVSAADIYQALLDSAIHQQTTSIRGITTTGGRLDLSCVKKPGQTTYLTTTCQNP